MNRRTFLAGALGLVHRSETKTAKTRLILLGTGGGPRPRIASSGSSQVVVADGTAYVVDCGDGVARQLVFVDVPVSSTTSTGTRETSSWIPEAACGSWITPEASACTRTLRGLDRIISPDPALLRRLAELDRDALTAPEPAPRHPPTSMRF